MLHTSRVDPTNNRIEVVMAGEVDPKNLVELMMIVEEQASALLDRGIFVKVLVDFSRVEKIGSPLKTMAAAGMKDFGVTRMAGFGAPRWLSTFTDSVAVVAGMSDKVRNFSTREEAESWLDA